MHNGVARSGNPCFSKVGTLRGSFYILNVIGCIGLNSGKAGIKNVLSCYLARPITVWLSKKSMLASDQTYPASKLAKIRSPEQIQPHRLSKGIEPAFRTGLIE